MYILLTPVVKVTLEEQIVYYIPFLLKYARVYVTLNFDRVLLE